MWELDQTCWKMLPFFFNNRIQAPWGPKKRRFDEPNLLKPYHTMLTNVSQYRSRPLGKVTPAMRTARLLSSSWDRLASLLPQRSGWNNRWNSNFEDHVSKESLHGLVQLEAERQALKTHWPSHSFQPLNDISTFKCQALKAWGQAHFVQPSNKFRAKNQSLQATWQAHLF